MITFASCVSWIGFISYVVAMLITIVGMYAFAMSFFHRWQRHLCAQTGGIRHLDDLMTHDAIEG